MDVPDTEQGNNRIAYKVVIMTTLWVDNGPEHDSIANLSKQIVEHEVTELLDGAGFRIGDTGYEFNTAINSIEFVQRNDVH
jgi:hypothetical protein|tara:strand:- start:417 stop:659 length:243 start_codon:yes stop_codon:yes gene_type:complete